MNTDVVVELDRPEVKQAAVRALLYGVFAAAVEYPDEEMLETIAAGTLADRLSELLTRIDPELTAGADWLALADTGDDEDSLQIEYTRLFDVGSAGTPPCSLSGGTYTDARLKTMEELIRFYNHFEFSMAEPDKAMPRQHPDHLAVELEFLHALAFHEAREIEAGDDATSYQRAQRDFIHRHPARWVPQLQEKLAAEQPSPFLAELFRLLDTYLRYEDQRLHTQLGTLQYTHP